MPSRRTRSEIAPTWLGVTFPAKLLDQLVNRPVAREETGDLPALHEGADRSANRRRDDSHRDPRGARTK